MFQRDLPTTKSTALSLISLAFAISCLCVFSTCCNTTVKENHMPLEKGKKPADIFR